MTEMNAAAPVGVVRKQTKNLPHRAGAKAIGEKNIASRVHLRIVEIPRIDRCSNPSRRRTGRGLAVKDVESITVEVMSRIAETSRRTKNGVRGNSAGFEGEIAFIAQYYRPKVIRVAAFHGVKNAVVVIDVTQHRRPGAAEVRHAFCRLCALQDLWAGHGNMIKRWDRFGFPLRTLADASRVLSSF